MHIDIVTTAEGLQSLRADWNALIGEAVHSSAFMTWEWQALWWKHYGAGRSLRVYVVSEGARVVGIMPLYIERQRLFRVMPLRVLRNVGTGGDTAPDDLHPLIAADCQSIVAARLAKELVGKSSDWDIARISDLAPGSELENEIKAQSRACRQRFDSTNSARMYFAKLPASWDEYLSAQSKDRRWTIRSSRRKFLASEGSRFVLCDDSRTLDITIDSLIELHRLRWEARSEHFAFSSAIYCDFHRELMHAMLEAGMLRLYSLEIEGRIVAVLYCLRFGSAVYYFQGGFDPRHAKLRPGLVLMGYAIEAAIEEGCKIFDMLRGEYDFKAQWAGDKRETRQIELLSKSFSSAIYRFRTDHLRPLYRLVKGKSAPMVAEQST